MFFARPRPHKVVLVLVLVLVLHYKTSIDGIPMPSKQHDEEISSSQPENGYVIFDTITE